jgi:hypothetical protein
MPVVHFGIVALNFSLYRSRRSEFIQCPDEFHLRDKSSYFHISSIFSVSMSLRICSDMPLGSQRLRRSVPCNSQLIHSNTINCAFGLFEP